VLAMVSESRINSRVPRFIFNVRKNKHQSILRIRFPKCRNSDTIREYMKMQDDKCIIITVQCTGTGTMYLWNVKRTSGWPAMYWPHTYAKTAFVPPCEEYWGFLNLRNGAEYLASPSLIDRFLDSNSFISL
jgi:hypothetical protein